MENEVDKSSVSSIARIHLLDGKTIDKIAAGEVIERPVSVVKELVENSLDAGAVSITVEIKGGGIDFIRVTDDGSGIPKEQVRDAFLPHATSKIGSADDLFAISSLGFRGEALSTIAAVSQVEMITKIHDDITGIRYRIDGGTELSSEEVGAPDGTTFIARNIFFHTPARRKFLKSAMTEAGYITSFIQRISISFSSVSFKYVVNGQTKLVTTGKGDRRENIYRVYGRDIAENLLPIRADDIGMTLEGYAAKPLVARSSREFEIFFVNGRYVEDKILSKALEEAYKPFLMQHRFPFAVLIINIDPSLVDVNVHPRKTEVKFIEGAMLFELIRRTVNGVLGSTELINDVVLDEKKEAPYKPPAEVPEPFEKKRLDPARRREDDAKPIPVPETVAMQDAKPLPDLSQTAAVKENDIKYGSEQLEIFTEKIIKPENRPDFRIVGQVFETYWIIEYHDRMLIIDQHAAHEKVMYERFMKQYREGRVTSQYVNPPVIVTLDGHEEDTLRRFMESFNELGFEISPFEGSDYAIRAVPSGLMQLDEKEIFTGMLDEMADGLSTSDVSVIHDRIAQMSCKAAVKGNTRLSVREAEELITELLSLENPYNCPHGRPTIIEMTKKEMEKKFKRLV